LTLVVDASVALKWVVSEVLSAQADRILVAEHDLVAPDLLAVEAANALWKKTSRQELSARQAREALGVLLQAGIAWHSSSPLVPRALELAHLLRHPVYDCVYVALAERLGATLVTADEPLRKRVAKRRDIRVRALASF
jgi:predicted nucleic acid-binding protein